MRLTCISLFFVALTAFPTSALAANTDDARQHYDSATAHFAVGEFAEAAAEYQAAFKAKPDPALLYDAAQAYRLANNPEKALILYRNYLQLYPNEANIAEVRAQIDKLREAIAAADKAKTAPPTGTTEPKRIDSEPTHPIATQPSTTAPPTSAAVAPHAESAREGSPIYKKWWLWTIVGVVVVGGVVTAAVLATRSSGTWSNAPDVGPGSQNGLTALQVRW